LFEVPETFGNQTYAITEKTDNLYYGKAYNEPVALIVGSEELVFLHHF